MNNNAIQFQSTSNSPPKVDWTPEVDYKCALDFKWIHVNATNRIGCVLSVLCGVHVSGSQCFPERSCVLMLEAEVQQSEN